MSYTSSSSVYALSSHFKRAECVWSAWWTMPMRWTTPAGAFSGAARERGTSAPRALDVPAF